MTGMPKVKIEEQEQQIPQFTTWDRVFDINNILAELESGVFYTASLLTTQLLRDDRLRGCMNVRVQSVLGMPFHMEASKATAKARANRVADAAMEQWPKMVPGPQMADILKWSILLGMCPASKVWDRKPDAWTPSLRFWHPGAVYYDTSANIYKLQYAAGITDIPEDSPNWVICTPYGYKYARLNGLLSAIAIPVLARQWALRDRARYSEQCGQPMRVITAPTSALPTELSAARRAMSTTGSETVLSLKAGVDGNRWEVALVEASGQSAVMFKEQLAHLDDVIAVAVLGQTMSTKGQGGLGAQEDAGGSVRRDIMRFDAQTMSGIATHLLRDWAQANYGDADLAPTLCIEIDPPDDQERNARIYGLAATAVTAFQAARVNVDVDAMMEMLNIPIMPGMDAVDEDLAAGAGEKPDPIDPATGAA